MNVHESEKLAGMLESLEYIPTENTQEANIIVFNTCSIREAAVSKAFGNIGALKSLKQQNKNLIIAVGGCMTQNKQDAIKLKNMFPFVDIIFGTHNLHEFKQYVIDFQLRKERILDIWENEEGVPNMTEITRTSGNNAWVNITYGCNNFCTYCIVPYVRGRERSRDFNTLVAECEQLVAAGYKTITLLGQNVNSYGNDIASEEVNFANLLRAVANIEGDFKVKFMTSHPKDLNDEVIKTIATNKKISRAVHLPVQSGSDATLKAMNRGYTVEHYKQTVQKLRNAVPDVILSSDFIVGFPGETQEDFDKTKELVAQMQYEQIFAYMYSKRNGTEAAAMENQVPYETKNARVNELLKIQKEVNETTRPHLIGKIFNVLIQDQKGEKFYARTDSGKLVEVQGQRLQVNNFYDVQVVAVDAKKLTATLI